MVFILTDKKFCIKKLNTYFWSLSFLDTDSARSMSDSRHNCSIF